MGREARTMKKSILTAIADKQLFDPWFKQPATWAAWHALLAALFGLPMTEADLAIYRACTGRTDPPTTQTKEAWLICGRRAGKSFVLALIATYLATFHDYRRFLTPGERGVIVIIARDRKQGRVIFGYIKALLTKVPMLRALIERETADSFDLAGGVSIEILTASFKSIRGRTVVACLADEISFWPTDDAADPDYAVLDAVRPAMATIPNAMLLCASSPYAKRGALHDAFKRHYAKDGDPVLVWKAATRTMNPTVGQHVIDAAMERDAPDARAEYLAEFRSDLESFISVDVVEACVERGVIERPPTAGKKYVSFTDPSGGSGDSMVGVVGHLESGLIVVDAVREILAPFDPESATDELARLFHHFRINTTHGDAYSSAWCRTAFERRAISYVHCELPRTALYLNLLPYLNARTIRLLDHPKTVNQIAALERRTARGARDSIDHPRDQHDDCANGIAGLAYVTAQRVRGPGIFLGSYEDPARGYREHLEAQRAPYLTINPQSPASTLVFPPEPVPPYKGAFTASYMAGRTRK
jgi:hypothetical protein